MTTNTCGSSISASEMGEGNILSDGSVGGERAMLGGKFKGMEAVFGHGWIGDWPWPSEKEGLV